MHVCAGLCEGEGKEVVKKQICLNEKTKKLNASHWFWRPAEHFLTVEEGNAQMPGVNT